MIVNEEDASKRWCPMVRQPQRANNHHGDPDGSPAACNTDYQGVRLRDGNNCIGSHCMMWRPLNDGRGYCGLAGKPEL